MRNPVECKDRVVNTPGSAAINQSERAQKQQHENSNKGTTTSLGSMPITENITR